MEISKTARSRARRGAKFLDKLFGGKRWARDISLQRLNINDGCKCIRGQLEAHGRSIPYYRGEAWPRALGMASDHGERVSEKEQRAAWAEEIRARRA